MNIKFPLTPLGVSTGTNLETKKRAEYATWLLKSRVSKGDLITVVEFLSYLEYDTELMRLGEQMGHNLAWMPYAEPKVYLYLNVFEQFYYLMLDGLDTLY